MKWKVYLEVAGILVLVLVAALVWCLDTPTEAQSRGNPQVFRVGYHSMFDFEWMQEFPYTTLDPMAWNDEVGFVDDLRGYAVIDQYVDCREKRFYVVYQVNGRVFVYGFDEPRGTDGHPHPVIAEWVIPQ